MLTPQKVAFAVQDLEGLNFFKANPFNILVLTTRCTLSLGLPLAWARNKCVFPRLVSSNLVRPSDKCGCQKVMKLPNELQVIMPCGLQQ